jgi:hypothetical protein
MHRHAAVTEGARLWLVWQDDDTEPRLLGTGLIILAPEGEGLWTNKTAPGIADEARALGYPGPTNMAFIRVRDERIAREAPCVEGLGHVPVGLSVATDAQVNLLARTLRAVFTPTEEFERLAGPLQRLSLDQRRYLRDSLRDARAETVRDREGFHALVVAIERLGSALLGRPNHRGLGGYGPELIRLASESALAEGIPRHFPGWHARFDLLYGLLRRGRNEAVHQGAYARLLADHAARISLVLEDALMTGQDRVQDFMVRAVTTAAPWQPIGAVREVMLTNSSRSCRPGRPGSQSLRG